jgi:hypothetical protein
MSCRVCGERLSDSPEDHFFGPPQVATNLPADSELCRLCSCFRLLAIVLRQLDPRTGVVQHTFLVLEQLILLLIATGSYAAELRGHRIADEIEWTDHPEDPGREPSSSGTSSDPEP